MTTRFTRNFIFISCTLMAIFSALVPSVSTAQGVRWEGDSVAETGWVFTDDGFIGWIWCGEDGRSDWVFAQALGQFLYMPVDQVRDAGSWIYSNDLEAFYIVDDAIEGDGWYWSWALSGWAYAPGYSGTEDSGWIYFLNTGDELPLVPDTIRLEVIHTADLAAPTIEERFAESVRIGADYIERFAVADPDISVSSGPDGVTFTNTLLFPGGNSNRFVRVGFRDGAGYLDLTALEGLSGRIGIVLHADVDLSNTTNGFYVRVLRGEQNVAAYERLSSGAMMEDILLEPYLTNYEDEAYIEITLPWQGSVTLKEIFLYMESKARGFANMEARITGGKGATPGNTHTVHNAAELLDALTQVRDAGAPSIIKVAGTVSYGDWVAAGETKREATIDSEMSNLSIIGEGDLGLMDGVGFAVQGDNVIIQNLTVRYVLARDAIQVNNGKYVKIDHCTLYNEPFDINPDKDKFDELISIKNNAQNVIVSWNVISDSHKTILVGSNDEEDALPDRRVIFHHNWFRDCGSRHPLYRGGYAHIYNNYFQNIGTGINVRTNSKILVEGNYFENVNGAIGYWFDTSNPAGKYEVNDNVFVDVNGDKPTESTIDIQFEGEYNYSLNPVEEVPSIVTDGAGVGKLPME